MMHKYRKRPVAIEAVQLMRHNGMDICAMIAEAGHYAYHMEGEGEIGVQTPEGLMIANVGDWIIKGVKGEFYPCKDEIFHLTYDLVRDEHGPDA